MIPVGDSTYRRRTPWVNYLLIAVNVLAFLFELSLGPAADALVRQYGVTPALVVAALAGDPRVPSAVLWTLLTSMFLHAGWLHIGSNMLFLWVFGDNVEDRLGHLRYLFFYLVCGVGASFAQILVDPWSRIPLIGASGAIAGVLGAYLVLYPRAWVTVLVPIFFFLWPMSVPVILVLGLWFITQLASGVAAVTMASQATGGVAYWAHIGGFVLGVLLLPLIPKASPRAPLPALGKQQAIGGCPRWLSAPITFVEDVLDVLITARILVALVGVSALGPLAPVGELVLGLTWPLVQPFARILPALLIGGLVLELYSILALLVYHLAVAAVLWALTAICRPRQPRYYYRRLD